MTNGARITQVKRARETSSPCFATTRNNMKRRYHKKASSERPKPKKFVYPLVVVAPQKRAAIAQVIADKRKRREQAAPAGVDSSLSNAIAFKLNEVSQERGRVRKQVHTARHRVRTIQEERRRLMALLVSVVNGASRSTMEALTEPKPNQADVNARQQPSSVAEGAAKRNGGGGGIAGSKGGGRGRKLRHGSSSKSSRRRSHQH